VAALQALPGVGPYTARAVAALAYGVPVGAVDVNVRRVLGRIVVGRGDRADSAGAADPAGDLGRADQPGALSPAALQDVADAAAPPDQPGTWTHAVMDVGATLCKPRAPRCGECPARPWCRYATRAPQTAPGAPPGRRTAPGAPTPPAERAARQRSAPFATTNRWLRGRILDRLRAVPDGEWVTFDAGIGDHDPDRVRAAAVAMAADGVLELHPETDGPVRARLPLS
jgi:A/G-specific adenine glycosylase